MKGLGASSVAASPHFAAQRTLVVRQNPQTSVAASPHFAAQRTLTRTASRAITVAASPHFAAQRTNRLMPYADPEVAASPHFAAQRTGTVIIDPTIKLQQARISPLNAPKVLGAMASVMLQQARISPLNAPPPPNGWLDVRCRKPAFRRSTHRKPDRRHCNAVAASPHFAAQRTAIHHCQSPRFVAASPHFAAQRTPRTTTRQTTGLQQARISPLNAPNRYSSGR